MVRRGDVLGEAGLLEELDRAVAADEEGLDVPVVQGHVLAELLPGVEPESCGTYCRMI